MDKPKPHEPPRPKPAPPETELVLVVRRCPFCHEGLGGLVEGVVSCAACDARHHTACWDEHQACSSCGGTARLVLEQPPPAQPHPRSPKAPVLLAAGLLACLFASGVGFEMYQEQSKAEAFALIEAERIASVEANRAARDAATIEATDPADLKLSAEEKHVRALIEAAKAGDQAVVEAARADARARERALIEERAAAVQAERTDAVRVLRLWSGLGIRGVDAGYFEGVRIEAVRADSLAARAGLMAGDHVKELIHVEGIRRSTWNACTLHLLDGVVILFQPDGSGWTLRIVRDGVEHDLPLPASEGPTAPGR